MWLLGPSRVTNRSGAGWDPYRYLQSSAEIDVDLKKVRFYSYGARTHLEVGNVQILNFVCKVSSDPAISTLRSVYASWHACMINRVASAIVFCSCDAVDHGASANGCTDRRTRTRRPVKQLHRSILRTTTLSFLEKSLRIVCCRSISGHHICIIC